MRKIIAIDPGTSESAYVWYVEHRDGWFPQSKQKMSNTALASLLADNVWMDTTDVVIENIASYGMPVGEEVFTTCRWIGRFQGAWESRQGRKESRLVARREVKLHLCNSPRATDATIRQALIDRFGGKQRAIGNKKQPGPLYGVSGDVWQALALAVTWSETQQEAP